MSGVGYALIALAVVYAAALVWLQGQVRRRSSMMRLVSRSVVLTALFAFSAGMVYVRAARGLDYDLYYRMCWIGWVAMAPMLQLCYELRGKHRAGRWIGALSFGGWSGVLVLCLTTDLVEGGAQSLVPFVDRVGRFEQPARALGAACLVWGGYEMYRASRATRGIERQRTSYFLLGLALYSACGVLVGGVFQLVGSVGFDPTLAAFFSVPWMALTFYAMSRYRLFDVRLAATRIIGGTVLVVLAVGVTLLAYWLLAPSVGPTAALLLASASGAILLVASPIGVFTAGALSRSTRPRSDAAGGSELTALTATLSLDDLLRHIVTVVRTSLGVRRAALFLQQRDGGVRLAHGNGFPMESNLHLSDEDGLLPWLRRTGRLYIREEHELEAIEHELEPLEVDVVVPITHDKRLTGLLMLGSKENNDAFVAADLDLLQTLARQASLAISNAQLYAALDEAKEDLDEFVRAAAHDLRAPLLGIDHLARFAQEDLEHGGDDVGEHLAKLRLRVQRMQGLLEAVEAYVRAGRDESVAEVVRLDRLAAQILGVMDIPEGFAVQVDLDVEVRTSKAALAEVLRQLLQNAIAHHDREVGCVEVTAERAGAFIEIVVTDDGPGVPVAYRERIFEMFRTLERRDIKESTGMGLALCRKLVQRAGGRIWVEGNTDRGASFHFTWPMRWTKAPEVSRLADHLASSAKDSRR